MADRNIKFLVDEMHTKMQVWLRLLGFDTKGSKDYEWKYGKSVQDKFLIVEALEEGRVLLTGDKQMFEIIMDKAKRREKHLFYKNAEIPHAVKIRQDIPERQMKQLHDAIPLDYVLDFNEMCCSECGGKNTKVTDKNVVREKVHENVFNTVDEFWMCDNCGKIFWVGSQTKNILATYQRIMDSL